ncbi:unnamed protein product [Cuscuta campestris]|uniref:Phytosulfokine n=1 Tax=Cuscuta campestris TaxID=132261 RepID=A0A484NPD4_9ASTE|nr:unnamed protein product [Cuscuta campestris]
MNERGKVQGGQSETCVAVGAQEAFQPSFPEDMCGSGEPKHTEYFNFLTSVQTVGSSRVVPESVSTWGNYENMTWDQRVVYDVMAPNAFLVSSNFNDVPSSSSHQHTDDINTLSDQFLEVLKAADEPLYPDCDEKSTLAAVLEILSIKSDWNLPEACMSRWLQTVGAWGSFQRSHSRAPPESPSTTTPQSIFNAGGDLEAEVEGEGVGGGEGGDRVSTEATAVPYGDLLRLITKAKLKGEQAVLNTIKGIIKESFHGPWHTYTTAPKEVRQRWWNLFRLRYTWLPGVYPADTEKIIMSTFNNRESVCEHIKKMEQEDKVVPNQLKVINRLFVKKGSQPSQEVAKIKKDYKEKLLLKKQAASGSGPNSISLDDVAEEELEDDLGLYVEVVGNNKNRVFGRGCEAGSSESLSSGGTSHEDYAARLKTELELKLKKEFEAKFHEKSADLEKKYQAQSHDLLSQFQGLKESVNYLTQGLSFQPQSKNSKDTMKTQNIIVSCAFVVFLFIFSQTISGRLLLEDKQENEGGVKLGNEVTPTVKSEYTDSLEELMGLEICENRDEECMRRRLDDALHLDYIYTKNKKPQN